MSPTASASDAGPVEQGQSHSNRSSTCSGAGVEAGPLEDPQVEPPKNPGRRCFAMTRSIAAPPRARGVRSLRAGQFPVSLELARCSITVHLVRAPPMDWLAATASAAGTSSRTGWGGIQVEGIL